MSKERIDLTNQFLIAMPGMVDETFAGSVVYLCEHNEKGALGLVINKPISLTLGNLFEKVELELNDEDMAARPVFFGGPVQTERGFVLHEPLDEQGNHYNATLAVPGGLPAATSLSSLSSEKALMPSICAASASSTLISSSSAKRRSFKLRLAFSASR